MSHFVGMLHTAGILARKNHRGSKDSGAMAQMRKAGAIPFALTNVSEACMWWESNNLVHGRSRNAYDTSRIVGGSSGGEACLLVSSQTKSNHTIALSYKNKFFLN